MKLRYRYAVISWCPDVTDPAARSLPCALLLVGTSGAHNFAASIGAAIGGPLDPLSAELLSDVPALVRRHVDDVLRQNAPSDPDHLLLSLHDALRNSLHVSEISEPASVETDHLMRWIPDFLTTEFRRIVMSHAAGRTTFEHSSRSEEPSPFQIWHLEHLRRSQDGLRGIA